MLATAPLDLDPGLHPRGSSTHRRWDADIDWTSLCSSLANRNSKATAIAPTNNRNHIRLSTIHYHIQVSYIYISETFPRVCRCIIRTTNYQRCIHCFSSYLPCKSKCYNVLLGALDTKPWMGNGMPKLRRWQNWTWGQLICPILGQSWGYYLEWADVSAPLSYPGLKHWQCRNTSNNTGGRCNMELWPR